MKEGHPQNRKEMKMVRVAACQLIPAPEVELRHAQMHDVLSRAVSEHVDFVCFPEGFLTGYYPEKDLARENALEVGEAAFKTWLSIAANYPLTVIVGFNEREGTSIFDSAAVIENGKLLGVQRKHYLYHPYFSQGTSFSSFHSRGISFGIAICLDLNYFEPARLLALQGAQILFSPMCNKVLLNHPYATRPPYYSHFVARSFENRCWLVTADWVWKNDGTLICPGHSAIYDPNGQEIARSTQGAEQLLISDIPPDQLFREKGRRVNGSPLLAQMITKMGHYEPIS